jgi:hypothetical protein
MAAQCDPNSFGGLTPPSGQIYCQNLIGNLGRNQIVGPGLFDMDFSIFKNFRVTERITTQFRVEMFNVLNHPSFLPPLDNEAVLNPSNGGAANNAGVIDATSVDPRQIQFGDGSPAFFYLLARFNSDSPRQRARIDAPKNTPIEACRLVAKRNALAPMELRRQMARS